MAQGNYDSAARGAVGLGAHQIDWKNPSDDELIDFVTVQYEAGKDRRRPWEAEAMENLAFLGGDQQVKFSAQTLDLVRDILESEVPEVWDQQIEVNTLKGFVLQRMAFLVGVPVTWFVRPFSGDDDDIGSARLGQKLLQHQWAGGDPGFEGRFLEALWVMFGTGVVFPHVVWDPTRGDRTVHRPPKGDSDESHGHRANWVRRIAKRLGKQPADVTLGADGGYEAAEGQVHVEFATGFELTEPAHCQRIGDAEWLLYSRLHSIESLRERYGAPVEKLTADNDSDAFTSGWCAEYGDYGEYSTTGAAQKAPADHAFVHEVWRPASDRYPKGYRGVVSQDKVLDKGQNPYRHGRLPFAAFKELPERRFRPHCSVRMLIKMQCARNTLNGKVLRHVNKTVDPHILAEQGAKLPGDFLQRGPSITEVPDGHLEGVKALNVPNLPPGALQMDERLRANMMEVMGVHDSSLGRAESAQQSGRHAAILQQSDARGNSVTRMLVEEGLNETGRLSLWLHYQYVRKERMLVLCGSTYAHEVVTFTGADLHKRKGRVPGPTTFNVEVSIGTEPDADAVAARIERLIKAGALDPLNREGDRIRIEKMLGEVSSREMDQSALHRSNAAQENMRLLQGDWPEIARGDADRIHIDEHERWTVSEEFRRGAAKDWTLSVRVEYHLRKHLYQHGEKLVRPKLIAEVIETDLRREYAKRLAGEEEAAGSRAIPRESIEGPQLAAEPVETTEPVAAPLLKFAQ